MKMTFANKLATIKETMKRVFGRITHGTTKTKILAVSGAVVIVAATATGSILLNKKGPDTIVSSSSSTVLEPAVTTLSLSQDTLTLEIGQTAQMSASPKPESSDKKIAVVWTSSDEKIATVSPDGLVTAVSKGTCTITASVDAAVSASAQITVQDPGEEEIALLKAYLKDRLQAPSVKSLNKSSIYPDGMPAEVTIKQLNDAAIVDLNGDNHYEMIVEHLFHMIPIRSEDYGYEPFYEIYYIEDGKVQKSPTLIGAENGDYMGGIWCSITQDTQTQQYFLTTNDVYRPDIDRSLITQFNTLDGAKMTPVMSSEGGIAITLSKKEIRSSNQKLIYALNEKEVDLQAFNEAQKRFKPVHFDLPQQRTQEGIGMWQNHVENKNFNIDQIKIFKNSTAPKSSFDDMIQPAQKRLISEPTTLLGMSFYRAKALLGDYHSITVPQNTPYYIAMDNDNLLEFDNYPFIVEGPDSSEDAYISNILIRKEGTNFYKDAKIGMNLTQISQTESNLSIGNSEEGDSRKVYMQPSDQKFPYTYQLFFDQDDVTQPSAKCIWAVISDIN
ncbi:Ig-like domain-containing protein [Faecalispora anaeroviscerum]|uniref:Ig-like domain-containing protein n=1 Tax=Faecalispora anaeroviscerum TaxID=2991836 RepID=UPI0024B978FB|nr:Ig-like domain-containing protein [Faecalispora anaeroviscerum]